MYKLNLITVLLFSIQICFGQTKKATVETKTMIMTFEEYSEGDYPHFIFKDSKTGVEYDFRHISDNKLGTLKILLNDDNASFGLRANPKYLKKTFTVVAIKKLVLDMDLDGKTIKVKDWVITSIKEQNSNTNQSTNQSSNNSKIKTFNGKILVSELAGQAYYRILVKPEGSIAFPPEEVEFYMSYNDWEKVKVYKNGKLIKIVPGIDEILVEGKRIKATVRENDSRDDPYTPMTINILN